MDGTTVGAVGLTMAGIVAGLLGTVIVIGGFFVFDDVPQTTAAEIEAVSQIMWGTIGSGSCCCLSSVGLLAVGGALFARRKPS
ncbi:MAG: hypothetical protein J0L92_07835 [Deltaproteobacteria bacterium]|nr:hypothetical protein [Deltaproteobacteria bacterium]